MKFLSVIIWTVALGTGAFSVAAQDKQPAVPSASRARPAMIHIDYGPCDSRCPVFDVIVSASGFGIFNGGDFAALHAKRNFRVSFQQFAQAAEALAPIRPLADYPVEAAGRPPRPDLCAGYRLSDSTRIVTWVEADGTERKLVWNTGCRAARYARVQPAIDRALALLGVTQWIDEP